MKAPTLMKLLLTELFLEPDTLNPISDFARITLHSRWCHMGIGGGELIEPSSWDSGASSTGGVRVVWIPRSMGVPDYESPKPYKPNPINPISPQP